MNQQEKWEGFANYFGDHTTYGFMWNSGSELGILCNSIATIATDKNINEKGVNFSSLLKLGLTLLANQYDDF